MQCLHDAVDHSRWSYRSMSPLPELILLRHGKVEAAWQKICYGTMDVSLGVDGREDSLCVAELLSQSAKPAVVYHSGLTRTQFLADAIVRKHSDAVEVLKDIRLREREFGQWQGKSWDEAYASDPENFHGLMERPDTYRPPDGETTRELQTRVVSWFKEAVDMHRNKSTGPIIAVTHSGPIAALAGHLLRLHARNWSPWIIEPLQGVAFWNILKDPAGRPSVHCTKFDLRANVGFQSIAE